LSLVIFIISLSVIITAQNITFPFNYILILKIYSIISRFESILKVLILNFLVDPILSCHTSYSNLFKLYKHFQYFLLGVSSLEALMLLKECHNIMMLYFSCKVYRSLHSATVEEYSGPGTNHVRDFAAWQLW